MTQQAKGSNKHPLDVTEVLEPILCMLDYDDLANARLVSRFWARAAHRAYWQFPDLRGRGHQAIQQRLERHGSDIIALNFMHSNLYSVDPLGAVDNITHFCPNVQELALPFGAFTFMGTRRLTFHYKHQLKVLRLDLSKTTHQPFGMDILTCLKLLECLELKTRTTNLHASFLNYDELFKGCPRLWELIITPAPYFSPDPAETGTAPTPLTLNQQILGHPLVQQNNMNNHHHHTLLSGRNTTTATLEAFTNNDLSRLKRLWLSTVWFSAGHIKTLARACPNLIDLRLSFRTSTDYDVPMPVVPFSLYLECWPNLKSLWIDGTRVSLPSPMLPRPQQGGGWSPAPPALPPRPSTSPASLSAVDSTMHDLHLAPTASPALRPISAYLTTLSLARASSLTDDGLIQIVNSLGTVLSRLNVDQCLDLTDKSIRHVLMHSPVLIRLSAAELNLTMNLFEDEQSDEEAQGEDDSAGGALDVAWRDRYREHYSGTGLSPNKHPIRGWHYQDQLPRQTWACASSLKTLDLSWRKADGRPPHVQVRHGINTYLNLHETDVQPVAIPVYSSPSPSPMPSSSSPQTPSIHSSARDAHGLSYTYEFCSLAELERWQQYDALRVDGWMGYYQPIFRKKFRLASMYHRLRQLVNLEALLLRGWCIPWRACDLVAFTPPPAAPSTDTDEVSATGPEQYHADISLRKWHGHYHIQALDGMTLPALPRNERLSQHLQQEGFIPNLRYLDITLQSPKVAIDPHNETAPDPLSGHPSASSSSSSPSSNTKPPPFIEPTEYAQYSLWAAWIATCPRLTTILTKAQWLEGKFFPAYCDDVQIRLVRASEGPLQEEESTPEQQQQQQQQENEPVLRSAVCTIREHPSLTNQGWAAFIS
ncbi:hypothetical protein BGZ73_000097 [Actinomortierella ambigua]|nr:hypothetical protein BGZ73_000097 [Actinomortierella ambigua]